MEVLGFIPAAPVIVPAVSVGVKALTWAVGAVGAVATAFKYTSFAPEVAEQVTKPAEPPQQFGPPAPEIPEPEPDPVIKDSPLTIEPVSPPVSAPQTPLRETQQVQATLPPVQVQPQSPMQPQFQPAPVPDPYIPPGASVLGGFVWVETILTTGETFDTKLRWGPYSGAWLRAFDWDIAAFTYRVIVGDRIVYQPRIELKRGNAVVHAWEPQTLVDSPPIASGFDVWYGFTGTDGKWHENTYAFLLQEPSVLRRLPAVAASPLPGTEPQVAPLPAVAPAPSNPFDLVPQLPDTAEPLAEPEVEGDPAQSPVVPPLPEPPSVEPEPDPNLMPWPPLAPNTIQEKPAITTTGTPVIVSPPKQTDPDTHVIGDNITVTGSTASPTLSGIAKETARIEGKLKAMIQPDGPSQPNWADLFNLLWALSQIFESPAPGAVYRLQSVCEKNAEGQPVDQAVEEVIAAEPPIDAILSRLDALVPLLQGLKDFKQPVCTPTPISLTGRPVTINWVSDAPSPFSNRPLRKKFTYFDPSGATLEQTVNHWKDFTWQAGDAVLGCEGTQLGKPQVWGATLEESRRVIEHAAAIAGVDLTSARWLPGASKSSRYGISGTMRVDRDGNGTLGITKRDGPSGWPDGLA